MATKDSFVIGLDYGSNSVRGLAVDVKNGRELASFVFAYPSGSKGILLDPKDVHLARQNPKDYTQGAVTILGQIFTELKKKRISPLGLRGIGVDTTGSTPMPVDAKNRPLMETRAFAKDLAAMAWLWKDHTGSEEAAEITALAAKLHPEYLAKCGGTYSSEWFWSKLLRCARKSPKVFAAAHTWVEICDWIPAWLCGVDDPSKMKRGICSAGHKAMFHESWGGLPSEDFLKRLDPRLASLRPRLYSEAHASDEVAGFLRGDLLAKWGFPSEARIPVAVGAFDAHHGAVGSGVREKALVKIIGTSTCDITVGGPKTPDIPGVCGVVPGSVLPGQIGVEAGQSAVGDILNWFVERICLEKDAYHGVLTAEAARLQPGESGLLALDWNNGNRTILVDPELSGMIVGMTLHTRRAEMYRALIEGTAFGARRIIERIREGGVPVETVIACGGISQKNPLFMQIYADVIGKPIEVAASSQTCALGAAIFASVAGGAHSDADKARKAMVPKAKKVYRPRSKEKAIYERIYALYVEAHDAFGRTGRTPDLSGLMKELLRIKKGR